MKKFILMFTLAIVSLFVFSCTSEKQNVTKEMTSKIMTHEDSVKLKEKIVYQKYKKACKWIEHTIDSIGFIYDKKGGDAFRKAFNNKMLNDKSFLFAMLKLGESSENTEQKIYSCKFSASIYAPGKIATMDGEDGTRGIVKGKRFVCIVSNIKELDYDGYNVFAFSYQIEGICLNSNPKHIEWNDKLKIISLNKDRWDKAWSEMSILDKSTLKCGDFLVGCSHSKS